MSEQERKRLEDARIAEGERSFSIMSRTVRGLQAALYEILSDYIVDNIETDDSNRIKLSKKNLSSTQGVFSIFKKFGRKFQQAILQTFLGRAEKVFDLNDRYFLTFADVEDISEGARLETLLRWGYNAQTKQVIPGGYLDTIFANANVSQRVASLMNQAITSRMSLKDFRKTFRTVFVGAPGAGMIDRDFNRATFDLFQQIDRTSNLIYADRLGLNYAVYSGTVMKTTRPFCRARVNKVFSRDQIDGWADLEFQGKTSPIYNPYINCGGYNCRHHLSFVTDEVATVLLKRQKAE